jgi:septal ring factor EnvC (AmiA/AmiB activator)
MSRYEHAIVDYENEKRAFTDMLRQKDQDIAFIKAKYEETNTLWNQENLEKQKLEAIIDQQYREAMELDSLRRRAEDERNQFRTKNVQLRSEIEELIKENKKLVQEKTNTTNRLMSLRQVNK